MNFIVSKKQSWLLSLSEEDLELFKDAYNETEPKTKNTISDFNNPSFFGVGGVNDFLDAFSIPLERIPPLLGSENLSGLIRGIYVERLARGY